MKLNILKARIKHNGLEKYAGRNFRDETSQIVTTLNEEGKKALLGIQRRDGVYTILGEQLIYFSTVSGNTGEIPLDVFSDTLHIHAMRKGKMARYKFLKINEEEAIWLHRKWTMTAIWNTALWLIDVGNAQNKT